jgi:flagellar FliL protein
MADAPPAVPADAAPAAPKSGSKLLIIILAVVLAAAGAGGGVYFFTRPAADHAEAKNEKGKKETKKEPKAPAVYVAFDPPFVVNFEAKGMMRFLQVSIEVMTRDPVMADMIKQHEPVLRNDLLLLLGNQTYETISTREGKEQLRKLALDAVAKVVSEEGGDAKKVEQLYFTSFVMQ